MNIDFQDRNWVLDEKDITNKQAERIREHTGLSVQKFFDSLKESDAFAWESSFDALYWVMLQQNPDHAAELSLTSVPISDVDYPVYRFILAFADAKAAEAAAEKAAEPDPTQPQAASAQSKAPSSRKPSAPTGGPPDG